MVSIKLISFKCVKPKCVEVTDKHISFIYKITTGLLR